MADMLWRKLRRGICRWRFRGRCRDKVTSVELIAIGFLSTRIDFRLTKYPVEVTPRLTVSGLSGLMIRWVSEEHSSSGVPRRADPATKNFIRGRSGEQLDARGEQGYYDDDKARYESTKDKVISG
ncbi:unnamed protein product [Rhodiola kirilowii]